MRQCSRATLVGLRAGIGVRCLSRGANGRIGSVFDSVGICCLGLGLEFAIAGG